MNANQWYNLKYITDKLGDRANLLSDAQVKIDLKDRVLFKLPVIEQTLVRTNSGVGKLRYTKRRGIYESHFWDISIVFSSGVKYGKRVLDYIAPYSTIDYWKVYIDQETFNRVFLSIFGDNNECA